MTANIGTYDIAATGQELEGMFHGTTLNQVTDLYGVYDRAALDHVFYQASAYSARGFVCAFCRAAF